MKHLFFIALLVALTLTGCHSQRRAERKRQRALAEAVTPGMGGMITSPTDDTKTGTTRPQVRNTQVDALQAKLALTLRSGNKAVNLSGTLRAKRDDVVQLNLVYTVLIMPVNVGTLELTPTDILIVDRMGKRYCRVAYSDTEMLRKQGIDFAFLQDLMWGDGEELKSSQVGCTYDSWTNLSQGRFPAGMTFTLKTGGKSAAAVMQLSDIQETSNWATRTSVTSKYQQVSLETVMQALMSVAK